MGLFKKYLDEEDKFEFRLRQQQINEQLMIVEGLRQMMNNWFVGKLSKYKLDPNKKWAANPVNGQISEIKDMGGGGGGIKEEPKTC